MSEENVVDKEKPLEKMTVTDLRDMAKDMPGIAGVHGMKKDDLIVAIKEAKGIKDEPVKKADTTVGEIKKQIKAIKAQRQGALEAKDSKMAGMVGDAVVKQTKQAMQSNLNQQPSSEVVDPAKVTLSYSGNMALLYFDLFPRKITLNELNAGRDGDLWLQ